MNPKKLSFLMPMIALACASRSFHQTAMRSEEQTCSVPSLLAWPLPYSKADYIQAALEISTFNLGGRSFSGELRMKKLALTTWSGKFVGGEGGRVCESSKIQFEANLDFKESLYWAPRCNQASSNQIWGNLIVGEAVRALGVETVEGRIGDLTITSQKESIPVVDGAWYEDARARCERMGLQALVGKWRGGSVPEEFVEEFARTVVARYAIEDFDFSLQMSSDGTLNLHNLEVCGNAEQVPIKVISFDLDESEVAKTAGYMQMSGVSSALRNRDGRRIPDSEIIAALNSSFEPSMAFSNGKSSLKNAIKAAANRASASFRKKVLECLSPATFNNFPKSGFPDRSVYIAWLLKKLRTAAGEGTGSE